MQQGQRIDTDQRTLGKARARQQELLMLIGKYLLRRRKDNTIKDQLPEKEDNIVFCEMSEVQVRMQGCRVQGCRLQ